MVLSVQAGDYLVLNTVIKIHTGANLQQLVALWHCILQTTVYMQ